MGDIVEFPKKGIYNRIVELETEIQCLEQEMKRKDEIIEYYREKYEELKNEKESNSKEEARESTGAR